MCVVWYDGSVSGDVAVCLYDAEGRDVAIETVDNGNNTFDVAFVPESLGPITAKIYFADTEVPDSPYSIRVQPHLPVDRITVHRPQTAIETGTYVTECILTLINW